MHVHKIDENLQTNMSKNLKGIENMITVMKETRLKADKFINEESKI